MESSLLQNATGTTIAGAAQVINAGRDVLLHIADHNFVLHRSGMSDFICNYKDYPMAHGV